MPGAVTYWGCWLPFATGSNDLPFLSGIPPLAAAFPWFKAGLVFLLAMVIATLLCAVFHINPDTFQGLPIWVASIILLTIALLRLFGLITSHTVVRLLIWCLYGIVGIIVMGYLMMFTAWLQERISRKSKGPNGE